jgi:hypothetical protein
VVESIGQTKLEPGARGKRSKEGEKEMEMLVVKREVEKNVVGEERIAGEEKRMELMVVGEGV